MAVMLSVGVVTAQDKNQNPPVQTGTTQHGPAFVDRNNNGTCDNFERGNPVNPNANGRKRMLNGSGIGRGQAIGQRNGRGKGAGIFGRGRGRRPRQGFGLRNGTETQSNFADTQNNAVVNDKETNQ